jgi:hypothetical protein
VHTVAEYYYRGDLKRRYDWPIGPGLLETPLQYGMVLVLACVSYTYLFPFSPLLSPSLCLILAYYYGFLVTMIYAAR